MPLYRSVLILVLFLFGSPLRSIADAPARPNLVIFLADDLGWGDIGANGSKRVKTPRIDRLGAEGVRFTQFYAPAAVCSPTRAGILTGRNPFRLGIYTYIPNNSPMHVQRGEPTIASLLRESGYDTCFVGKWGANGSLSDSSQAQPGDLGFDHWFATQNNAEGSHLNPGGFVRNGKPVTVEGYSAQIVVDEALHWLHERKDSEKPFCLFVWFHEPHRVIATPESFSAMYRERFPDRTPEPADSNRNEEEAPLVADYLGNISHLDHQVGRLVDGLEELHVGNNTLVVFTSDNGPIPPGSTGGLTGGKTKLTEGGIRMPGFMRWPERIRAGQVSDVPAGSIDLLATACAMAGIASPTERPTDGTSLMPLFDGEPLQRVTPLFWRNAAGDAALRDGDWKLHASAAKRAAGQGAVAYLAEAPLVRFELFNLRTDPTEKDDRATAEPERLAEMKEKLLALHAETQRQAPRWSEKALPGGKKHESKEGSKR